MSTQIHDTNLTGDTTLKLDDTNSYMLSNGTRISRQAVNGSLTVEFAEAIENTQPAATSDNPADVFAKREASINQLVKDIREKMPTAKEAADILAFLSTYRKP
jgi:autotransporter adhesin